MDDVDRSYFWCHFPMGTPDNFIFLFRNGINKKGYTFSYVFPSVKIIQHHDRILNSNDAQHFGMWRSYHQKAMGREIIKRPFDPQIIL